MSKLFALVDCNNFYVSCERIFNPKLENKPVVVLSNNDGCIISRSEEAKQLGIKMGVPAFEIIDLLEKEKVNIFSTNYPLYGDMSQRVMSVLSQFSPTIEVYSIDEAFLDLTGIAIDNMEYFAKTIITVVEKWTGIPVSVGIGSSKTLAKAANYLAKKTISAKGIFILIDEKEMDKKLPLIPVNEIWGIGPQHTAFLSKYGVNSASDLKNINEKFLRKHFGVLGERTAFELRGISCYPVDDNPAPKKAICFSRSFGTPKSEYDDIEQITLQFAETVARKLRKQKSVAQSLTVFVMTNRFARGPQYVNGKTVKFPVATNQTSDINHYTLLCLKDLFRQGYRYKKTGIIANDIITDEGHQCTLWEDADRQKKMAISEIIDRINDRIGINSLRFAVLEKQSRWKMRQENLSPQYTTKWEDLLNINIDNEPGSYQK